MAALFRVKAVYEYSSPHEDDLNFDIGQVITVTDEDDADWYGGEYTDANGVKQEGIFPRNFVEKIEPTAPPRPTRTRPKKEVEEPPPPVEEEAAAPPPPPPAAVPKEEPAPAPEPEPEVEQREEPLPKEPPAPEPAHAIPAPAPAPVPVPAAVPAAAPAPAPIQSPSSELSATSPPVTAEQPVKASKPKAAPPPVAGKPLSNAFKDRIAAFNKPAAAPIAPFKPGGASGGFIKKPFVAPPPSRNAYVPPPREAPSTKVYRRDEDPEIKERESENQGQAERAGLVPAQGGEAGDDEDQPQPTVSLKERIALLQQQQREQAQRHADAATKKEKPKKPAKKPSEPVSIPHEEDVPPEAEEAISPPVPQRRDTEDMVSTDDGQAMRSPPPPRRKPSKGTAADHVHDGNEADMSGAGDTTEGQDDTTEREDNDEPARRGSRPSMPPPTLPPSRQRPNEAEEAKDEEEGEEEDEEEDEVDPEVRRKEELRARMAKMSGGMGFHGMFGGGGMPIPGAAPPKKKKAPKPEPTPEDDDAEDAPQASRAPPVPTMMALPGMGGPRRSEERTRDEDEDEPTPTNRPPPLPPTAPRPHTEEDEDDEDETETPGLAPATTTTQRELGAPPPIPGGRPAPPPVPAESRQPPPPPENLQSPTEGSASDDELSGTAKESLTDSTTISRPPPVPAQVPQSPALPSRSPPLSPRMGDSSPASPVAASKRTSRPPPPIPGSMPPPPMQSRPPPPPPPGAPAEPAPTRPPQAGEENEEENSEYEGDYDTDIASSVPHKDALKAHARESSLDDNSIQSPVRDAPSQPPPIPGSAAPRAVPPPIPSQPPQPPSEPALPVRRSVDAPRGVPPPPPPGRDSVPATPSQDEYDPYSYTSPTSGGYSHKTPKIEEEAYFPNQPPPPPPSDRRPPPAAPTGRGVGRVSSEMQRPSVSIRRSLDTARPQVDSDFIANDMDLAVQSGWWKQANQVPPVLQGRKDIFFESTESTTTNQGSRTVITREVFVLFQDYSQSILTARYDPYDPSDVELDQRHDPPPRALRQDQMEEFYERFGRPISEAVSAKKDSVVGDGTPQGLIAELLRPFNDALRPVGTRAYGALVYSNMANASTQQNDVIRPGDILSIRNGKFQGKHGPMHAKYTAEVGKPDHVAVVAEWDGTKKKVRAWEQGRESKKVKVESFKLDDLRSGEVKIWRVMPRSWVGWNTQS